MSAFHTDGTNPLNLLPTAKKGPPKFEDYWSGSRTDPYGGTRPNDPKNVNRRVEWWNANRQWRDDLAAYYGVPGNRPGTNSSYGQTNSFTDEFGNVVNRDQAPPPPAGSYVKPYQPNGGVTFVGQSGNPSSPSGFMDMSPYGALSRPQTDLRKLLKKR